MSNLPKRKKTPEEIAKLRESMGLCDGPAPLIPPPPAAPEAAAPAPPAPADLPPPQAPPAVAPQPILPTASHPAPEMPAAEPRTPAEPKQVRSLRKSERGPAPAARAQPVPSDSATVLPSQRRTDFEINQLRRTQAFSVQPPVSHLIPQAVHPFMAGLGYLCVFVAAVLPFIDHFFTDISRYIPGTLCLAGLAISVFILLKKKRSLHHAGFISAIAIFTLIFGALYYFPHLRNAP
ncbi:hypothetical protein OVA24_18985 [Luteolibacter sp. SL250]|uniref:hypothetical protein n=1 Tax=Luteolibacter sp. SL250 TaxID=2995170 RepID=UPI00226E5A2E|nr:hypothetical protein [Luteolibacter sp. SL250]WAC19316.1 hypothetical protein OVA24_18985 [Luteolibacter sp. SL250]